jgi:hypothetical protein
MQRDWEVTRQILLKIEALSSDHNSLDTSCLTEEGVCSENVAHHVRILIDSGLIAQICWEFNGQKSCHGHRLTWEGHEILDKIRREAMWARIKETAREKGLDLTTDVVKAAAKSLVSQLF